MPSLAVLRQKVAEAHADCRRAQREVREAIENRHIFREIYETAMDRLETAERHADFQRDRIDLVNAG